MGRVLCKAFVWPSPVLVTPVVAEDPALGPTSELGLISVVLCVRISFPGLSFLAHVYWVVPLAVLCRALVLLCAVMILAETEPVVVVIAVAGRYKVSAIKTGTFPCSPLCLAKLPSWLLHSFQICIQFELHPSAC